MLNFFFRIDFLTVAWIFIVVFVNVSCESKKEKFTITKFTLSYNAEPDGPVSSRYVNDHAFIYDSKGNLHLFGTTGLNPTGNRKFPDSSKEDYILHAVQSSDGIWKTLQPALKVDPEFREDFVWAPDVIKHNQKYYLFYSTGTVRKPEDSRIHLAISDDLVRWTRSDRNPLFGGIGARDPHVIREKENWILYYSVNDEKKAGFLTIKARTSQDLLAWSEPVDVFYDRSNGYGSESPFVWKEGESFFLSTGPRPMISGNLYGTEVFESFNPFHFETKDRIARINGHAVERLVRKDGKVVFSHCGWNREGVYFSDPVE